MVLMLLVLSWYWPGLLVLPLLVLRVRLSQVLWLVQVEFWAAGGGGRGAVPRRCGVLSRQPRAFRRWGLASPANVRPTLGECRLPPACGRCCCFGCRLFDTNPSEHAGVGLRAMRAAGSGAAGAGMMAGGGGRVPPIDFRDSGWKRLSGFRVPSTLEQPEVDRAADCSGHYFAVFPIGPGIPGARFPQCDNFGF